MNETKEFFELQWIAKDAWVIGMKPWKEEEEVTVLQGNQSIGGSWEKEQWSLALNQYP